MSEHLINELLSLCDRLERAVEYRSRPGDGDTIRDAIDALRTPPPAPDGMVVVPKELVESGAHLMVLADNFLHKCLRDPPTTHEAEVFYRHRNDYLAWALSSGGSAGLPHGYANTIASACAKGHAMLSAATQQGGG